MFDRKWCLDGMTFHMPSGCGTVHVTVNFQDEKPVEIYAKGGTKGGCNANMECIGRLISVALQDGVEIDRVLDQLGSVRCPTAMANKEKTHFMVAGCGEIFVKSCSDAIGKAIKMAIENYKKNS